MMKKAGLLLGLAVCSAAIGAEHTDSCAGLESSDLTRCRSDQQTRRQEERLEQMLQQQEQRQNQLAQQQREVQQQLDSMRQQNESLRKQLERETASPSARTPATVATASVKSADVKGWRADNPWYGSDYAKTQFATRYIGQLQQERPDLAGRELLDALSTKVNQVFAAKR